jgi:hypothetical protein
MSVRTFRSERPKSRKGAIEPIVSSRPLSQDKNKFKQRLELEHQKREALYVKYKSYKHQLRDLLRLLQVDSVPEAAAAIQRKQDWQRQMAQQQQEMML